MNRFQGGCPRCGGGSACSPKGHQSWCDRLELVTVGTWDDEPYSEHRLLPEVVR